MTEIQWQSDGDSDGDSDGQSDSDIDSDSHSGSLTVVWWQLQSDSDRMSKW